MTEQTELETTGAPDAAATPTTGSWSSRTLLIGLAVVAIAVIAVAAWAYLRRGSSSAVAHELSCKGQFDTDFAQPSLTITHTQNVIPVVFNSDGQRMEPTSEIYTHTVDIREALGKTYGNLPSDTYRVEIRPLDTTEVIETYTVNVWSYEAPALIVICE